MISFKLGKGGHFCGLLVFNRFMPSGIIFMNSLSCIMNKVKFNKIIPYEGFKFVSKKYT